ncbi:glutathione S-transferase [Asticcacaulis sp. DXS10W]|uniref:Glutathione S-transferase n=1 Tax=Asticcacaulis currens TaxID=2984210 RepID=A0ABT5IDG7_9CAUL|nr:glutathione S-transferase [Asticcacaulis currens]MDC7694235.1 glutathione S-transferase [Asticcacaulis currens]
MQLLYQTHSPYARKALVFAHEVGLADRLEVIHHETSPTNPNEVVFAENPLGKVPVLLRPGESALFDSDVICAYLDTLHPHPKLIPQSGEARWSALLLQAAAQGVCDSGVSLRWETLRRPEALRYPPLAEGFKLKLVTTYGWLDEQIRKSLHISIGHIAVATALSWIEFRNLPSWREHKNLAAWMDEFSTRPSMLATPLHGEAVDHR